MLKLTKTGIGLLTRQYRSVLKKCWAINVGLFILGAVAATVLPNETYGQVYGVFDAGNGMIYFNNGFVTSPSTSQAGYALQSRTGKDQLYYINLSDYGFTLEHDYNHGVAYIAGANSSSPKNATAAAFESVIILDGKLHDVAASLNNYYRKEDLGSRQVIDFARYFKSGRLALKSENLGVDLTSESENLPSNLTSKIGGFATNHPPRLGAFVKCEKACSRLSERFPAKLRKIRAFEDIASADAGTFLFVSQTRKNVLAVFSQTVANINVVNDNFTVVTNTVVA